MIISLTSIPPRFATLDLTLKALAAQLRQGDELRVYIPAAYRRFPDSTATPHFQEPRAEIWVADQDYGPATKILPCLKDLAADPDQAILYCDDDRLPPPGWLDKFRQAAEQYPDCAIAAFGNQIEETDPSLTSPRGQYRAVRKRRKYTLGQYARRLLHPLQGLVTGRPSYKPSLNYFRQSGTVDIAHGAGGVLVRPRFFGPQVFDVPDYAFHVDDVWISGHLAASGTPIWVDHRIEVPRETEVSDQDPLVALEVADMNRQMLNARCATNMADQFGIWRTALDK